MLTNTKRERIVRKKQMNPTHDEWCEGVDAVQYEENISLIEENIFLTQGRCLPNPKKIFLLVHNIEESNTSGYC